VIYREASLCLESGDGPAFEDAAMRLFDAGFRDDDLLGELVLQVGAEGRLDDVEDIIARFGQVPERGSLVGARARVVFDSGEQDAALDMLRPLLERRPFDVAAAMRLADISYDAGLYTESIAACEALVEQGYESSAVLNIKGWSEANLSWHEQAKDTFARAVEIAPADQDHRSALEYVTSMLGRGDTTSIREPLEMVEPCDMLVEVEYPEAGDHPYVVGRWVEAIRFEPGVTHSRTEYLDAKILDRRGVERLSTFRFTFDPLVESMFVNLLEVRDAEGRVITEGSIDDYYVISEGGDSGAGDERELTIPVPGLAPGCTVHLAVTRRHKSAPDELPYVSRVMSWDVPVRRSGIWLVGDVGSVAWTTTDGVDVHVVDGGRCWLAEDPRAYGTRAYDEEAALVSPTVRLASAGQTWAEIAESYLEEISHRLEITDRVRERAAELVGDAQISEEKLHRIATGVQQELSYRAISFGPRAWVPSAPDDVLRNGYGDCKDHALLTWMMLRAEGVDADLALVCSESRIDSTLPDAGAFDHMIVHVPGVGGGRFVDPTAKYVDMGLPAPGALAGRRALVLRPGEPRLVEVPQSSPDWNLVSVERRLSLGDDGVVRGVDEVEAHGAYGAWLRMILADAPPTQRAASLQDVLGMQGEAYRIEELETENVEETGEPVKLRVTFASRSKVQTVQGHFVAPTPFLWELLLIDVDARESRELPFRISLPRALRTRTVLELPSGHSLAPETIEATELRMSGDFWVAEAGWREDVFTFEARLHGGRHEGARYGEFVDAGERLYQTASAGLVLMRP
jgi:tetratricopeptide (TPR) repeat protein